MTRIQAIRALIGDCTEDELTAVLLGVLNGEWVTYSDRFVDAFHDTFEAFDADLAAYAVLPAKVAA